MITKKSLNSHIGFICEKCDYKCFRKSDYTKHLTTNKHKNNEKRSKIQRKTKKRVLRGGQGEKVSSTRDWLAKRLFRNEDITHEQCIKLRQNIQDVKSKGNTPELTDRAKEDKRNCSSMHNIDVEAQTAVAPEALQTQEGKTDTLENIQQNL